MGRLRSLSVLFVIVGLVLVVGSFLSDRNATWMLTGMLLLWAGITKVVVMHLWRGLTAGSGLSPDTGDR